MRTEWFLRALSVAGLIGLSFAPSFCSPACGQTKPEKSDELPEMQITEGGFLAFDTPKGWERVEGPGLACFVPKDVPVEDAAVWIYISGAPIGEKESAKNRAEYIQSDIAEFRKRFADGIVREEDSLELPKAKTKVPVVHFESNDPKHNSFEEVIYIEEQNRVLMLVLSAKNAEAFEKTLPIFRDFARSYGGSITMVPDSK